MPLKFTGRICVPKKYWDFSCAAIFVLFCGFLRGAEKHKQETGQQSDKLKFTLLAVNSERKAT